MARRTGDLMYNNYLPDDMGIYRTFHPEFGRDVYQPAVDGEERFIEPYTTEKEAYAYLKGYQFAMKLREEK